MVKKNKKKQVDRKKTKKTKKEALKKRHKTCEYC